MKEVKLYECSICYTLYNEKLKCKNCEESHRKPIKICEMRYLPQPENKKGYPQTITVEMDNGDKVIYHR